MNENTLNIKVERIYKIEGSGPLKAFVDIGINDCLLIRGIKLIDGRNGMFVSMPAEKAKDNKWYENVRCLSKEFRQQINDEVLSAYMAESMVA